MFPNILNNYKYIFRLGGKVESSGSDCDSNLDSELSSNSLSAHYQTGELMNLYQFNNIGNVNWIS